MRSRVNGPEFRGLAPWLRGVAAVCLAVLATCSGKPTGGERKDEGRRFTLFFTGELKGTIEPCGCTTDPLGDLARTTRLIGEARSGGAVLLMDAGSLLYTHNPIPPDLAAQEDLKAKLLLDVLASQLQPAAIGLGPFDLSRGPGAVSPPRLAANVPAEAGVALEPAKVLEVGGVKVGVFGVVSPAAVEPFGIEAGDPLSAANKSSEELRARGAELVIGLAHMTKGEARALAKELSGVDVLVVGQNLPEPDDVSAGPDRVGDTWLVAPANRGQIVTRIEVTMRSGSGLEDAIGPARAKVELERMDRRIEELKADLGRWKADPKADPSFVAQSQAELERLQKERSEMAAKPLRVPAQGHYFTMQQVEIERELPCAKEVVAAKTAFDKAAAEANLALAKDEKPVPPAKGQPGFVGSEECSYCHAEATALWKTTKHAQAWETLEKVGKELNRDCIYCHVTGWQKPGGSTLAFNDTLRDVQCETCHGPGSLHVEADGNDSPRTIVRTPEKTLCMTCHNSEHSDTFQFEAYLRDVTGKGHGQAFRDKLGGGPTGHELRAAGLEKAGMEIGAGCPK